MTMRKKNQSILVIGVVALTLIGVVIMGASGLRLGGATVNLELPDFPSLADIRTDPDSTNTRDKSATWTPLVVNASAAPACENWLMYHSNQSGSWSIYRLDNLGNTVATPRNLSNDPTGKNSVSPSRSPDGKWVAFASNRDGNWEIYVTDAMGNAVRRMTFNSWATEINPVWSPNGKFLVYESTRNGNWDLYTLDVQDGTETRLTTSPGSDLNAYWSADSAKVLFQSDRDGMKQIYEIEQASGTEKKISQGVTEDSDPSYAPDGKRIIYLAKSAATGNQVVTLADADGNNLVQISDETRDAAGAVWSKDGTKIVYQTDLQDASDLVLYDVDSGLSRDLTTASARNYAPTWICDSADIAFTSTARGAAQIYLISAAWLENPEAKPVDVKTSTDVAQLTKGDARSEFPQNSPSIERGSRKALLAKSPARR